MSKKKKKKKKRKEKRHHSTLDRLNNHKKDVEDPKVILTDQALLKKWSYI